MKFGSVIDFLRIPLKNLVFERAVTSTINAALTEMGQAGYDTTLLRLKIFDGTTVRKFLQDNDISTDVTLGGSSTSDILVASQKAVKAYIDSVSSSGLNPFSDFNAAAASGFPASSTLKDRYRVTTAATLFATTVNETILQVGDVLQPRVASASTTTASDWIVIQGNADKATNSVLGLILIGTLAELNANLSANADKAVTISVFNAYEAANPRVKKYTTTVNLAAGSTGITHNLNSTTPSVDLYDASGPIWADWSVTSANVVTITTSAAINSVTVKVIS
jgi:hypothetical protein